jgi:hypothetical protein
MKNLYLVPTDKPSRLAYLSKKGKEVYKDLRLFGTLMPNILDSENQHIYITSDEEIKGGEYVLIIREGLLIGKKGDVLKIESTKESRTEYIRINGTKDWFASDVNYQKDWNYKKIILTTDEQLIADGIQAIDDSFIEWYVKNPSYEEIKTESLNIGNGKLGYVICKPQEEPKQKTLEEAAKEFSHESADCDYEEGIKIGKYQGFIEGAKWQQAQDKNKYSEQEVLKLLITFCNDRTFLKKYVAKQWFKKFKKK